MDNPKTLATLATQDTERRQIKKKKKIQHNTTQETKKLSNTMNLNLTNEIVWDDQCRENYNVT
jgi:hypothetical protein